MDAMLALLLLVILALLLLVILLVGSWIVTFGIVGLVIKIIHYVHKLR